MRRWRRWQTDSEPAALLLAAAMVCVWRVLETETDERREASGSRSHLVSLTSVCRRRLSLCPQPDVDGKCMT